MIDPKPDQSLTDGCLCRNENERTEGWTGSLRGPRTPLRCGMPIRPYPGQPDGPRNFLVAIDRNVEYIVSTYSVGMWRLNARSHHSRSQRPRWPRDAARAADFGRPRRKPRRQRHDACPDRGRASRSRRRGRPTSAGVCRGDRIGSVPPDPCGEVMRFLADAGVAQVALSPYYADLTWSKPNSISGKHCTRYLSW